MIQLNEYCSYEQLDNNIHRVELSHHSIEAADGYLEILDQIISTATENNVDKIRLMVVIKSKQMPSLQYLATRAKKILAKYPNRPMFRNVYIFGEGFMVNLLHIFIKMVVQRNTDKMNFFQYDKIDDAFDWLMEDN